jgi:hypothetical protein
LNQIRKRLTYANVMSSIAVFLVIGGATAIAASKKIGTNQLKANSITTGKIKKNAVTTAKIKDNAVNGAKVNESTLGEVPNAANAQNVDKYVPFGIVTVGTGQSVTLVSYGPFSLIGQCQVDAATLEANVIFATTEDHTAFGGDDTSNGDVGPGTPESSRIIEDPGASSAGAPDNSDGYDDQFNAQAPSGRSWAGTVESWVSKDAGQCRWSGFILKTS